MTWTPSPGMTARQAEKGAQKAALEFEAAIMQGFRPDDRQTFEQYAAYFMEVKRAEGMRISSLSRNHELLHRILPAIGHIPIKSITPQQLNALWRNLQEPGINLNRLRATLTETYKDAAKAYTFSELAAAVRLAVCIGQRLTSTLAQC